MSYYQTWFFFVGDELDESKLNIDDWLNRKFLLKEGILDLDLSVDSIGVELALSWEMCVWLDWSKLVDYTFAYLISYIVFDGTESWLMIWIRFG